MATKKTDASMDIIQLSTETIECCVLGKTPIILNRMSEKAKRELLLPRGRKTQAQKATSLKHNPIEEFRAAPYTLPDDDEPTFLAMLSSSFKAAIRGAGVDIPGASKAQLGRLMWVNGERVPMYGIPRLHMSITRSADKNRTPDVRTRVIVPRWALRLSITYVTPQLNAKSVSKLLAAAGLIQGVGDWRPEKGSRNFGQFELVSEDDADYLRIIETGGRKEQIDAMESPAPYDQDTEELLEWFNDEIDRRGKVVAIK